LCRQPKETQHHILIHRLIDQVLSPRPLPQPLDGLMPERLPRRKAGKLATIGEEVIGSSLSIGKLINVLQQELNPVLAGRNVRILANVE
jgi:hypothetical protein